jgi:hypothetical protein
MKKLTHIATALAQNTLSMRDMTHVRGGADTQGGNQDSNQIGNNQVPTAAAPSATDDEKRRQRPGGGISTN